jgi:hypothetical protein
MQRQRIGVEQVAKALIFNIGNGKKKSIGEKPHNAALK